MRVWTYVAAKDDGAAPNFEAPATTFVLARPRIRRHASRGDAVLAFNGRRLQRLEPHSVFWAGVVSEVVPLSAYWDDPRFQAKKCGLARVPDNIYFRIKGGSMLQTQNCTRGPAEAERDVSGMHALVLGRCWRSVKGASTAVLPERFEVRITAGRTADRCTEIDEAAWRDLVSWLDGNLSMLPAATGAASGRHAPRSPEIARAAC